ncbi:helix-turn-helix domain-containing protein [Kribbella sp. NBC_01245]|uniref:helix-turn-helix domain-containing protein n=1 Tax=Kribbella sp. NBC_01245 TaxID=2903578 RepID=UPI002E2ACDFA|nr:helix-turn-helix transcriptional regulator [Kribbella sp. NBC_01245]
MDEQELGAVLRARRKAAGRTIASVAMDAGLSVPYIANLENARGNPTVAALQRLARALGADLQVNLADTTTTPGAAGAAGDGHGARVLAVAHRLAVAQGNDVRVVQERLEQTIAALSTVLDADCTDRDVDRLLDAVLLAVEPGR